MEEILEEIHNLRFANQNVDRRYFVPEVALFEIMTISRVKHCLECLKFPLHELNVLTDDVMRGSRKCFAILLLMSKGEIIKDFITHDDLLRVSPDDRLPFNSETLKKYFRVPENSPLIRMFMEKQWDFATPTLSRQLLSRELNPDAILPYLHEETAGNGSMGRVLKVTLHTKSHRLPAKDNKVCMPTMSARNRRTGPLTVTIYRSSVRRSHPQATPMSSHSDMSSEICPSSRVAITPILLSSTAPTFTRETSISFSLLRRGGR